SMLIALTNTTASGTATNTAVIITMQPMNHAGTVLERILRLPRASKAAGGAPDTIPGGAGAPASEASAPPDQTPRRRHATNSIVTPRPTGPRWMAQPSERYSG